MFACVTMPLFFFQDSHERNWLFNIAESHASLTLNNECKVSICKHLLRAQVQFYFCIYYSYKCLLLLNIKDTKFISKGSTLNISNVIRIWKVIASVLLPNYLFQIFESFLAKKFPTLKRYSGEGAENMQTFFYELFNISCGGELVTLFCFSNWLFLLWS